MVCDLKNVEKVIPAVFSWALLLVASGLFFAYPCWYLTVTYSIAIPIVQGVITFFVFSNLTLATFLNPGVIPKARADEYNESEIEPLFIDVDVKLVKVRLKWCMTCHFFRPPRCTHCGICDSCIEVFDHHCPWLNNCIGRRNYRFFYLFLVWLSIHIVSILGLCILYMREHLRNLQETPTIITITIITIIIVFIIPILGLTAYHSTLILRGRTTNEQVTNKFHNVLNPYSEGYIRNMLGTLCSSLHPSYGRRKSHSEDPEEVNRPIFQIRSAMAASDSTYFSQSLGPRDSALKLNKKDFLEYQNAYLGDKSSKYNYIGETTYNSDTSYHVVRSSRAITPPVCKHNSNRFHHLRRSLPTQGRLHASGQLQPASPPQNSELEKKYIGLLPYGNDLGNPKDSQSDFAMMSPEVRQNFCLPANTDCQVKETLIHKAGNQTIGSFISSKGQTIHYPNRETYCLENEGFDTSREHISPAMPSGLLSSQLYKHDTLMSQCRNFCKAHGKAIATCDYNDSRPFHSPTTEVVGPYSQVYKKSLEDIVGEDMSVPFTGRRPLSFVRAIEMSDAVESGDHKRQRTLGILANDIPIDNPSDTDSKKGEISYEICV